MLGMGLIAALGCCLMMCTHLIPRNWDFANYFNLFTSLDSW
jgi:hypothetical protein